jgi:hypothetical protein
MALANDVDKVDALFESAEMVMDRFLAAHEKNDLKGQLDQLRIAQTLIKQYDAIRSNQRAAIERALLVSRNTSGETDRVHKLVDTFILCARVCHFASDELADIDFHNEAVLTADEVVQALDATSAGRNALAPLLRHGNIGVRASAGAYLIKTMPEQTLPVLRAINDGEAGSSAWFTAHWAIVGHEGGF